MENISLGIITNLLSEFIVVVLGVLSAQFIRNRYDEWRYGKWQVIIKEADGEIHKRAVSPKKAKQILEIPEDLSVFLKGVASAYDWINVDLITEGREIGMLEEDRSNRRFVINMDKNPQSSTKHEGPRSDNVK